MKECKIIELQKHNDLRGGLVVGEIQKEIPFEIKRFFFSYGFSEDAVRGQHANKNSEFVMVCVTGSCKVCVDNGKGEREFFLLDKPWEGLYLDRMTWKEMYDFSDDAVLLCLVSTLYDGEEYIKEYAEFKKVIEIEEEEMK